MNTAELARTKNAFRLAVTIDETGGGSSLNDEIIALLASNLPENIRADILKEVQDEFGSDEVNYFHRPAPPPRLKTLSLPPRSTRRRDFWTYVLILGAFAAGAVLTYRVREIVQCTSPAPVGAAATPGDPR